MSFPCKGCENRAVGCHDHCDAYKKAKEIHEGYKEVDRKNGEAYGYIAENKHKKMMKWKYKKGYLEGQ